MAKWSGKIGFTKQEELRPGVIVDKSTERIYYGDVISDYRMWQSSGNVNDNLNINNKISVAADVYANQNIGFIKWIEYMGTKWKVKSVEVKYPRLVLTIGDLYNG